MLELQQLFPGRAVRRKKRENLLLERLPYCRLSSAEGAKDMRGHIRKRGKNSWSIAISLGFQDAHGKYKYKWHTVHGTKRDAEVELTRILKQLDEGSYVNPSKITVKGHLEKWLSAVEPNVSRKTFVGYQEICDRHLIPAFGTIRLRKLSPEHLDTYYAEALCSGRLDGKGGLTAQTVLHHHRILSQALERAVKWQLLGSNPAKAAEPPRVSKTEVRALDTDTLGTLLKAAKLTILYVPVLLAVTTGLRRGELLGLKWADVDLEAKTLRVQRSVGRVRGSIHVTPPKTEKSRRTVALPESTVAELQRHSLSQKKNKLRLGSVYVDEDWVFARQNGAIWSPDAFTGSFRKLVRDSKLGAIRFHDLRHTHATQLLKNGIFIKVVSERLGHSSIQITLDTYAHVLPGMQDEAAASINATMVEILGK